MAGRLPSVARRRDPTSRSIARALGTVARRRLPADERAWIDRIQSRRRALRANLTAVAPSFDAGRGTVPGGMPEEDNPIPLGGIAEAFSIPERWGIFLFRLVRELAPVTCLELGTGLGISTAYQAAALQLSGRGRLTTLEGAQAWAGIANDGLRSLGLSSHARLEVGPIDEMLDGILADLAPIDYAFLDADHSEEATVKHFEALLPHIAPGGVVVLDDISFTQEMWSAWQTIAGSERVAVRVPLHRMGLVTIE